MLLRIRISSLPLRSWRRPQAFPPSRLMSRWLTQPAILSGPKEPPLLSETIPQAFAKIVAQHGDRNAVISYHQSITLTYHDLDTRSSSLAAGLQMEGVKKGDRVAVSLGNNAEFAVITYALFKLGAILVPLNPGFNASQVASALNHLTVRHLIIGTTTHLPRRPIRDNLPLLRDLIANLSSRATTAHVESERVPSLEKVIIIDNSQGLTHFNAASWPSFVDLAGLYVASGRYTKEALESDETVNIQFTSGTTSTPKAVCLSHRNILNNGKSIGDRMQLGPLDIICCPPPLFHCFGSVLGYMASTTHGSCIVFPSEAFDPLATLQAVAATQVTALYGVPTMFLAELDLLHNGTFTPPAWTSNSSSSKDKKGPAFPSLRTGIAAGSSVPSELMRRLITDLGLTELTNCYGMTETSPVSLQTSVNDPVESRIRTVGRPLPHVNVKVTDPNDRGRILNVGERGELAVSGYLLMKGYWKDVEKTEKDMVKDENGVIWMFTGDEAMVNHEGYVEITGRIKDLIIRGGENIHPIEVESCLLENESVSDVAVIGVPDERYGEAVGAFVVQQLGNRSSDRLRQHVRNRLSNHLVPKHVWFLDSLPKTESGKVKKYELRERAKGLLQK